MATVDPELLQDAIRGDPVASALVLICDRLEALEAKPDAGAANIRELAYEAAAGARTEVRKLVEMEVRRAWGLQAIGLLVAMLMGFCVGWLGHWT